MDVRAGIAPVFADLQALAGAEGPASLLVIPPIAPIAPSTDSATAMVVVQAVANGELSAEEGAAVAAVIESHRKALEAGELEARVAALEAAGKGGGA